MLNEFRELIYVLCHRRGFLEIWEKDPKAEVDFVTRRIPQLVYYAAMHLSIWMLQLLTDNLGLLKFV